MHQLIALFQHGCTYCLSCWNLPRCSRPSKNAIHPGTVHSVQLDLVDVEVLARVLHVAGLNLDQLPLDAKKVAVDLTHLTIHVAGMGQQVTEKLCQS